MGAPDTTALRRDWLSPLVLTCLALAVVGYAFWLGGRIQTDPAVVFLTAQPGAEWIVPDAPVNLATRSAGLTKEFFRVEFSSDDNPAPARIRIRALKHAAVYLDGNRIAETPPTLTNWKEAFVVSLPALKPGRHELTVLVQNELGPVALWLATDLPSVPSGPRWQWRSGDAWKSVRLAGKRPRPALAAEFPAAGISFAERWPLLAAALAAVGAFAWLARCRQNLARCLANPPAWRWRIQGIWLVAGLVSLFRLPLGAGFDIAGHVEYISHILTHGRVPLATEGWQFFQSPLYYGVSAPLVWLGVKIAPIETVAAFLRVVPLLCGMLQIEVAYRVARHVFPGRADLQIFMVVLAGALPMNIYLSRYIGNEPLAALLSAITFLLCLRLAQPMKGENLRWVPLQIGVVFGLALLTKVSAMLMGGAVVIALAVHGLTRTEARSSLLQQLAPFLWAGGATIAIAGWYYARNWVVLGRPFVGGWDVSRGFVWWQEPGYRIAGDFSSFGHVLSQPIEAGLESVPGGLFASLWCDTFLSSAILRTSAPPWDYALLVMSVALAVFPALLLIMGLGVALRRSLRDQVGLLIVTTLAAYGVALLHHIVTVPYHCAIKMTYALGATPALVLLGGLGFEIAGRNQLVRIVMVAGIACWSVSAFAAYMLLG